MWSDSTVAMKKVMFHWLFLSLTLINLATAFSTPTNSCYTALNQIVQRSSHHFSSQHKSLSLEIGIDQDSYFHHQTSDMIDTKVFSEECGSGAVLVVELWRVISQPKIERPDTFGSVEYFNRDQHCESPDPDLLAKHGMSVRSGGGEVVMFQHVVEQEYMVRMCPCVMSHCTCETVPPGTQVCSKIFQVSCEKIFEMFDDENYFRWITPMMIKCLDGAEVRLWLPNPRLILRSFNTVQPSSRSPESSPPAPPSRTTTRWRSSSRHSRVSPPTARRGSWRSWSSPLRWTRSWSWTLWTEHTDHSTWILTTSLIMSTIVSEWS